MASRPLPHTLGHLHCPACEAERCEALRLANSADLPFCEAARLWLVNTREDVADQTHKDRQLFIGRLNRFFGEMVLCNIHIGNIKSYQKARQGKADDPKDNLGEAGPELINHEISALARILDAAGLWASLKAYYKCLKVPDYGPGRSMTDEQRQRLLVVASTNPRWLVAYMCTLLSLGTSRGGGEIRKIKIGDIDLRERNLRIEEGAKNIHRKEDFPMSETMFWACGQLLKRYYKLCEKYGVHPSPDHYLLPARIQRRDGYDFYKPQGDWRKAWTSLLVKADLEGFRFYDLRHDAATTLGKNRELSDHMKRAILGHTSKRMEKRYFHAQREAMLEALKQIEVQPAPKLIETPDGGIVEIPVLVAKTPK